MKTKTVTVSKNFVFDCQRPDGYVAKIGDCDDTNPNINPGNVEICDGIDNNCDGNQDDEDLNVLIVSGTEFRDNDNDGYGDITSAMWKCEQPEGYSNQAGDCDDTNHLIYPGVAEVIGDGVDQNCDGFESCYSDADNDGYGGINTQLTTDLSCTQGGVSINSTDCDDTNYNVKTSTNDQDCDGVVTNEDCDDNNTSMPNNDYDCDGTITENDCNDLNENSTIVAFDADCDGILTNDDCNDNDENSTTIAEDNDCDGTVSGYDCNDNDSLSTTFANDADCDGTITENDCNDLNENPRLLLLMLTVMGQSPMKTVMTTMSIYHYSH